MVLARLRRRVLQHHGALARAWISIVRTFLALTEDPPGFHTSLGLGATSPGSDVDYWRFDAQAGDRVAVAGDGGLNNNSLYVELRSASDTILAQAGDSSGGHAQISNFAIPSDGTY